MVFFNHEEEILHHTGNRRIRRADWCDLHVRQPWPESVQGPNGQRSIRSALRSRRALRLAEKNRKKIKKSLDFHHISDILNT